MRWIAIKPFRILLATSVVVIVFRPGKMAGRLAAVLLGGHFILRPIYTSSADY
jgi:hypothetical protein